MKVARPVLRGAGRSNAPGLPGGYGHHPLLCYLDGSDEALAGILRPGNAGSNTASDHVRVLELALEQLDERALAGQILARVDGAGASHEFTLACRETRIAFSVGFEIDERVRAAITAMPKSAWIKAIRKDGTEREHSQVCEITDRVDLSAWPKGSRLIARRTELREGDQQTFADYEGYRLSVFLTDQQGKSVPELDLTHRGHARVEDHIRQAKDCGLSNLPFRSFAQNRVWLWLVMAAQDLIAWSKQTCVAEHARAWELKALRYRLLHQSGRIARHARRRTLRLATDWPWAKDLASAFKRLQALPAPAA